MKNLKTTIGNLTVFLLNFCLLTVVAQAQFSEVAKIQASDKQAFDEFGRSVSISGDRAIVGAFAESTGGFFAGAAYIFERTGGGWSQVAKIQASDQQAYDFFGGSVSISGDRAIVGATEEDTGGPSVGAAYIFERSGGVWSQVAKIQASDKQAVDRFGNSVSISGDRAIVGVRSEDTGGASAGAAYIFEHSGGVWSEAAKIQASDKQSSDNFGQSVSINGDRAIVGADGEDTGGSGAGAAYIFERSGGVWSEVSKIQASDKQSGDNFGQSVSINGDRAIAGADGEDTGGSSAGAAYIFERSGGVWSEVAKIQASDKQAVDLFGTSVAIDVDRAIVGATREDTGGSDAGAAYIFERSGGVWSEVAKVQASDKQASDQFGNSVSISGDHAIVGARLEDTGGSDAGAAYTFEALDNPIVIACAEIQALLDDPMTEPDALSALQDAKDALNDAQTAMDNDKIEDMLNFLRDAADALEEAREDNVFTDDIAAILADFARDTATAKKDEALACDPSPTGKMADDIDDGDNDLADGDAEVGDTYFGDGIKDYRKAWEDYCSALDRCQNPKTVSSDQSSVYSSQFTPIAFALHQNYPNPFNPTTTIQFDLIEAGNVSLNIYNSAGQLVRTLVSGDFVPGAHKVVWDARDNSGQRVASGLYLYMIKVGQQFTAQKKLLLMK